MSVIDDYLQHCTPSEVVGLEQIRQLVRAAVPEAEEVISYGMPGFKFRRKYLLGFAAFKDHLSLFPTAGPIAAYQSELGDFVTAKGTIQFTPDHPIPDRLLSKIIDHRLQNM